MYLKKHFKSLTLAMALSGALFLTSCNDAEKTEEMDHSAMDTTATTTTTNSDVAANATAVITGTHADTTVEGSASFAVANGKVQMILSLTIPKMANKSVAVHLHEHGSCGDMGKDAHGHWNPTNQEHGKWGSAAFHAGDIGNVQLDASGKGSLTMETDLWTLGGDANTDIIGKAFIVHSGVDDYKTQPTGNAGSRIGCGVIAK